ncbi:MAG TPA: FecR domain-containing protein [Blastocatellia bacterium]|nr:FecR domain-containing protein [Blastocatellia bacterium]
MSLRRISAATLVLLMVAGSTFTQGRKPLPKQEESTYLVTVKAGIVNFIEGTVTHKRGDGEWDTLLDGDELKPGDRIETAADSRVEILLNPGSYLRVGENSRLELVDPSVENIKLHLSHGSIIIEASVINNLISLTTPQADYSISLGGIYRFNVTPGARDEVIVRQGAVVVGSATVVIAGGKVPLRGTRITGKQWALVGTDGVTGKPVIAKLEKRPNDALDDWSKDRAKTLVAVNNKIKMRALNGSLASMTGSNIWSSLGFWVYDPFFGYSTFLPFSYYSIWSPYGRCYWKYVAPGDCVTWSGGRRCWQPGPHYPSPVGPTVGGGIVRPGGQIVSDGGSRSSDVSGGGRGGGAIGPVIIGGSGTGSTGSSGSSGRASEGATPTSRGSGPRRP